MRRAEHFERQGEPALLPAGEDAHLAVRDFLDPDLAQDSIQVRFALLCVSPSTRSRRALSRFSMTVSSSKAMLNWGT